MACFEACQRCGAKILQQTARENKGRCIPCARRNRQITAGVLYVPMIVVALAFIIPIQMIRNAFVSWVRRYKFPYDFSDIASQVNAIYPNSHDAKRYCRNVIAGFYAPVAGVRTGDPRSLPDIEGRMDGSKLLRKEIDFGTLPFREIVFDREYHNTSRKVVRGCKT